MVSKIYRSPIGPLTMVSDGKDLTGLWILDPPALPPGEAAVFPQVEDWLDAYFRGDHPNPRKLPLSPAGTPFQKLVWELLLTIPYGETRSYGHIAKEAAARLGKEKMSAQAVGGAVGRNPICIIIPCHRVLGTNGSLVGFRDGLERKKWLLRHEEEHK